MAQVDIQFQTGTTATGGAITGLVSAANPLPVAASTTIAPGTTLVVQGLGTAGTAAGGVLSIQGEASMTPVVVSGTVATSGSMTVAGTVELGAGSAVIGHVIVDSGTIAPSGTQTVTGTIAVSGGTLDAVLQVGTANVGNTNPVPVFPSTQGFVSASVTTTGTATTSVIAAVTSNHIYVDSYSISNSGTAAAVVSFQDGSGGATLWAVAAPAGGGANMAGSIMFRTTAGNALFAAASAASTTITISASGFSSTL